MDFVLPNPLSSNSWESYHSSGHSSNPTFTGLYGLQKFLLLYTQSYSLLYYFIWQLIMSCLVYFPILSILMLYFFTPIRNGRTVRVLNHHMILPNIHAPPIFVIKRLFHAIRTHKACKSCVRDIPVLLRYSVIGHSKVN